MSYHDTSNPLLSPYSAPALPLPMDFADMAFTTEPLLPPLADHRSLSVHQPLFPDLINTTSTGSHHATSGLPSMPVATTTTTRAYHKANTPDTARPGSRRTASAAQLEYSEESESVGDDLGSVAGINTTGLSAEEIQALVEENSLKRQRLARKAALARASRQKKKTKLEQLEEEVALLKAELVAERAVNSRQDGIPRSNTAAEHEANVLRTALQQVAVALAPAMRLLAVNTLLDDAGNPFSGLIQAAVVASNASNSNASNTAAKPYTRNSTTVPSPTPSSNPDSGDEREGSPRSIPLSTTTGSSRRRSGHPELVAAAQ